MGSVGPDRPFTPSSISLVGWILRRSVLKAQGHSWCLCHFRQIPDVNCSRHGEASGKREKGGGKGKVERK